jgi:hypothetical protein
VIAQLLIVAFAVIAYFGSADDIKSKLLATAAAAAAVTAAFVLYYSSICFLSLQQN